MKLRRLHIRRMPGIDDGFYADGLDDGVKLIVGPNASGKSTICRAVRALLWPDDFPDESVSITADFRSGGDSYQVTRERKKVSWQKNGIDIPGPELPGSHVARCFTLGIPDLLPLQGNATDEKIASEIRRQMSGGYDIRGVVNKQFTVSDRRGSIAERKLRDKSKELNEIKNAQRALADEEDRLLELEAELLEAREAQAELDLLKKARELAEARSRVEAVDREIGLLPEGMALLKGDERSRLEKTRKGLESTRKQIKACDDEIAAATERIEGCSLPHGPIPQAELDTHAERARRLERLESEIHVSIKSCQEAQGRLRAAREAMDPAPEEERVPELDPGILQGIDSYLDRAARLQEKRAATQTDRDRLQRTGGQVSKQTIDRGINVLRSWLAVSTTGSDRGTARKGRPLLAAALAAIGIGLILVFFLPWLGASLVGLGLGVLLVRLWPEKPVVEVDEREHRRRDYEQLGLREPGSWSKEEVSELLQELEVQWAGAAVAEQQLTLLQDLEARERELEAEEQNHALERKRIARTAGLDPGLPDLTLAVCARKVMAWAEARQEHRVAEAALQGLRELYGASLNEINAFLSRNGEDPGSDAAQVSARIADLNNRSKTVLASEETRQKESERKSGFQEEKDDLERSIDALWIEIGIKRDDEHALFSRLDHFDQYRDLVADADHLNRNIQEVEERLASRPELARLPVEVADSRIREAEERVARLEKIGEERGAIERQIRETQKGNELELALAGVEKARTELEEQREEGLRKTAGRFLLQGVRDLYDRQSQPEVMQRSGELFGRFTHHQYELLIDEKEERPAFRALDTVSGSGKSLSELSDATRVQLLLAVRIAFANQVEKGTKLPLFLDEVLTTSDPARFRAVVEILLSIVRDENRQVFYLSANPADVAQWNAILSETGAPPLVPFDLANARRLSGAVSDVGLLEVAALEEIPAPGELTAEQYGALLSVPPFDPDLPLSRLHLYYLLRGDLPLLHSLLKARIETVGQWRALVSAGGGAGVIDPDSVAYIGLLTEMAETFIEYRNIGRGKKIDGDVLRDADVSRTYLDRFTDLVKELGGDARRFMAVLDEKGDERTLRFRDAYRETLRGYLIENGYIDDRPVLDESGLRARLLSAMANHLQSGLLTPEEVGRRVHEWTVLTAGR